MNKLNLTILTLISTIVLSACTSNNNEKVLDKVNVPENLPITEETDKASTHLHPRGDGTVPTAQGVSINLTQTNYKLGNNNLNFIINRMGEPVDTYIIKHEKPLHFIVVDKKLGTFQHLHPVMKENFTWSVPVNFENSGDYRVYADFTLEEGGNEIQYLLGADISVSGSNPVNFTLPEPTDKIFLDDLSISVSGSVSSVEHTMLMFTVLDKNGDAVSFDPYLGSTGHLIAVREGDLAMSHMHNSDHNDGGHSSTASMPGMLHFDTEFPSGPGRYRLFLEFVVNGERKLATFTTNVL